MKMRSITIAFLALAIFGLSGCGNNQLKEDVAPLADAMCQFIEIRNNLKAVTETADSVGMHKYEAEMNKMTIEITILNQEFQEKYGDKIKDKEFGKKFKREMNKAMIECPYLSAEDRDKMEAEINE